MDGNRFDDLTRALRAGSGSRRAVLKGLAGTALAALFGRVAAEDAAAAVCKQGGGRCRRDGECCSGNCRRRKGRCTTCGRTDVCADVSACGPSGSGCECFFTTEGTKRCVNSFTFCEQYPPCSLTPDCPSGSVCVRSCCSTNVCVPLCGNTVVQSAAAPPAGAGSPSTP